MVIVIDVSLSVLLYISIYAVVSCRSVVTLTHTLHIHIYISNNTEQQTTTERAEEAIKSGTLEFINFLGIYILLFSYIHRTYS